MGFFDDKQKENMTGIYFASTAALIVILFGLFSGSGFGSIFLKLLIGGVLFYGIGFGVIILFKQFVPEILETPDVGENVDATVDDEEDRETIDYGQDQDEVSEEFEESEDDRSVEGLSVKASKDKSKITITSEDGEVTEDPETVAKAIRTMMSRDED